eukprot:CAMPEP_0184310236 /NCGR_PEP_ID=MMETSP1049-20130417/26716_1 /TAXON_ID=77928 /ORGANISM="Proteomonas sulcata, Strain CCMP704" /LENGTH=67 /DNA_ID=CAMNT_0026624049 /DNA_START=1 /DNA_END=201 /DNA_ORIENTATION=-
MGSKRAKALVRKATKTAQNEAAESAETSNRKPEKHEKKINMPRTATNARKTFRPGVLERFLVPPRCE